MADEQEPIALVEPEAPAIEQEVDETVNLQTPEQEEEAPPPEEGVLEEPAEPEEELEEFDWNGKQVKGPKGLKDGLMMQADYTRKTQEVASTRKELEQRAAALEEQYRAADEEMDARASLKSIEHGLKSYENVDWDKWVQESPIDAQAAWIKYQQLQQARGQFAEFIGKRQTERTEKAQQETAKRLQETRQFAETQIKGWTPEVDAKVTDFAMKELGFDKDTLIGAYSPAVYKALHLAWIGHQAIQKPATAQPPKLAPQPLTVVSSKSNPAPRKTLAEMDMEEYVAARRKQSG